MSPTLSTRAYCGPRWSTAATNAPFLTSVAGVMGRTSPTVVKRSPSRATTAPSTLAIFCWPKLQRSPATAAAQTFWPGARETPAGAGRSVQSPTAAAAASFSAAARAALATGGSPKYSNSVVNVPAAQLSAS